jgi:hypothetical protein
MFAFLQSSLVGGGLVPLGPLGRLANSRGGLLMFAVSAWHEQQVAPQGLPRA